LEGKKNVGTKNIYKIFIHAKIFLFINKTW